MEPQPKTTPQKHEPTYGEGDNLTHYLGNDDYKTRNFVPDDERDQSPLDGYEAQGNDINAEEDDNEEQAPNGHSNDE